MLSFMKKSDSLKISQKKNFISKIYFIRKFMKIRNKPRFTKILNEKISISKSYINFFILFEWDLSKESPYIYFENEQKLNLIKKLSFKIHPKSKTKLSK